MKAAIDPKKSDAAPLTKLTNQLEKIESALTVEQIKKLGNAGEDVESWTLVQAYLQNLVANLRVVLKT